MENKRYISHNRSDQFLRFPKTTQYFWIDRHMDATWMLQPLISPYKNIQADVIRANKALKKSIINGWPYWYLMNRLREHIALRIFCVIMKPAEVQRSSIVQDIVYGIDAIARFWDDRVAIDFTENLRDFDRKTWKTRGASHIMLPDEKWNKTYYNFIVVAIVDTLINTVLGDIETLLSQDTMQHYTIVPSYMIDLCVDATMVRCIKKDLFPPGLFQIWFPENSTIKDMLVLPRYLQKDPPPQR